MGKLKINKIPAHYYSSVEKDFLKNNYLGRTTLELTNLFNSEFKTSLTTSQIFSTRKRLKLKSGINTKFQSGKSSYKRGVGYQHYFTEEQIKFLKDYVQLPNYLLTEKFNEKFNTVLSIRKIISAKHRRNIKGVVAYGSRYVTRFKEGYVPLRYREIGSEVVLKNGQGHYYTSVKIKDHCKNDNFKYKHRIIYEEAHGKIPKGYNVCFADGNSLNLELDNLILMSNAELAIMNTKGLFTEHKEVTKAGANLSKLINQMHNKMKDVRELKESNG